MNWSQTTLGTKLARAAYPPEKRSISLGREWVAVFMNEETIVIALHGCLTAAEKALMRTVAGTAQVREFHRHLFAHVNGTLAQLAKSITGMKIRDVAAEIEPTTGTVVHVFTTDTAGDAFPLTPGENEVIRPSTPCNTTSSYGHTDPMRPLAFAMSSPGEATRPHFSRAGRMGWSGRPHFATAGWSESASRCEQ